MNERIKARAKSVMKTMGLGMLIGGAVACANIAGPNGGPYDEKPPRFVSSTPPPLQTNYTGRRVEIVFDELIQVEKPSQNVVIAPPQKELPSIQIIGRKIRVELKDNAPAEHHLHHRFRQFNRRQHREEPHRSLQLRLLHGRRHRLAGGGRRATQR